MSRCCSINQNPGQEGYSIPNHFLITLDFEHDQFFFKL